MIAEPLSVAIKALNLLAHLCCHWPHALPPPPTSPTFRQILTKSPLLVGSVTLSSFLLLLLLLLLLSLSLSLLSL
ncbi:hypothetical protein NMG60_11021742 [Bertholletia excelsa]